MVWLDWCFRKLALQRAPKFICKGLRAAFLLGEFGWGSCVCKQACHLHLERLFTWDGWIWVLVSWRLWRSWSPPSQNDHPFYCFGTHHWLDFEGKEAIVMGGDWKKEREASSMGFQMGNGDTHKVGESRRLRFGEGWWWAWFGTC